MTVYGSDGRVLTKADGSAYFSAIGQLGGRPRRPRYHLRMPGRPHDGLRARIKAQVAITIDGCWEWLGRRDHDGYGRMTISDGGRRRNALVHRVSYLAFRGDIPDGLPLDHLCRNRPCANPHHLEPVTVRENNLRGAGVVGVNAAKETCDAGHALDGDNVRIDRDGWRVCRVCRRIRRRLSARGISTSAAKESGLWAELDRECSASGFRTKGLADRPTAGLAETRHNEEEELPIKPVTTRFA